jgi:integrase
MPSRKLNLETPTARLKLAIRKKPYRLRLGPGLSCNYRRNAGPGTWSLCAADGRGKEWLKKIGTSDDFATADGKEILSFTQAVDRMRSLVQGGDGEVESLSQPATLKAALGAYGVDLGARGANTYNAKWPLKYLPASLLSKPIPLITTHEFRKWRDSLLTDHAPATVNRLAGAVVAACNLAAAHDPRIKSREAWRVGLQGIPDATRARNVILSDEEVRRFVAAAYERGERFGLFVETLAQTGARPAQAARLEVADLEVANLAEAKLRMPKSGKGGGLLRIRRKVQRIPVPISPALAARLKAATAGRALDAPLLLWRGDRGWGADPSTNYRDDVRATVEAAGLDTGEVTLYALRHSAIVRQLLANVPIRVIASTCDTSVTEIERHYSKYITEHSDALSRRALLCDLPPAGNNIVVMAR